MILFGGKEGRDTFDWADVATKKKEVRRRREGGEEKKGETLNPAPVSRLPSSSSSSSFDAYLLACMRMCVCMCARAFIHIYICASTIPYSAHTDMSMS